MQIRQRGSHRADPLVNRSWVHRRLVLQKSWRAPEGAGIDQYHAVLPDEWQRRSRPALNVDPLSAGNIDDGSEINIVEIKRSQGSVGRKVPKLIDDQFTADIALELGDVLWYIAQLATELGLDLDAVAEGNLRKLGSRAQRGTLQGEGDHR